MALQQDGFFDENSDRGEAPDDWVKTPGSAVIEIRAANDPERRKIKTTTAGVEKIELELNQGATGLVGYQNNLARYKQLVQSYGPMQATLRQQYITANPGARESTKDGIVTVYAPKKHRPAAVSYNESGPSISYPDLAYHHNVSFLQLRRAWNFCVAYGKKTSDQKPLIDLIVCLLNVKRGKAKKLVVDLLYTPGAVSAEDRTLLFNRLTWMGWNLVEGPPSSHRHDDPGESFDDFDTPFLDSTHSGRMSAIQTLNGAINNMTRQVQADEIITQRLTIDFTARALGGEVYRSTAAALRAAFAGIESINEESLIPFDPNMWEYVIRREDGRFQLRR